MVYLINLQKKKYKNQPETGDNSPDVRGKPPRFTIMIRIGYNSNKSNLAIEFPYDKKLVEIIQTLPSRQYNKKYRIWEIPLLDLPILGAELETYLKSTGEQVSLSEEARKRYSEVVEGYKQLKDLSELQDIEYISNGLKKEVTLYPFQRIGAKYLEEAKTALLAMDMGLGKTIMSLSAASNLILKNKIKKPLIICPASLKFNWAIEIAKFSDYSYTMIRGDAKQREKQYHNSSDFTIMNYDLLRHDIDIVHEVEWDLIIADEIQRAKNYTTVISRNIRTLQPEYIFGLTGTPIENDIMDLFTIMRFINPKMFGSNGMYFKQRYCNFDSWGKILGYREDRDYELDRKTSYFMIRRKKRDVLKDLPEKTVNNYYINLNTDERRKYNEFKRRVVNELESSHENSINVLSQIVFLREICDSINLIEPSAKVVSSKLDELKIILNDLPSESKVVIFTEYERMAQIIENNINYGTVHLHGGVKNECRLEKEYEKQIKKDNKGLEGRELDLKIHAEKQKAICKNCPYYNDKNMCDSRKKIISRFNDDPDTKIFLSTNAGKEGLNLQIANVVINFDLSFNPAVNEQRIARIDRIGQMSDKITVINLICVDTIEERILKVLEEKQALFDRVIDKTDKDVLRRFSNTDLVALV